jgi:hypothetical protein
LSLHLVSLAQLAPENVAKPIFGRISLLTPYFVCFARPAEKILLKAWLSQDGVSKKRCAFLWKAGNWSHFGALFRRLIDLSLENYANLFFVDGSVIRSHYVTMVDNNRGRFFLAVEPAYADVEYVFFIRSRWYHMLLLSCC